MLKVRIYAEPVPWHMATISKRSDYEEPKHIALQKLIQYSINSELPDKPWTDPVAIRKLHIWRTRPRSNKTSLPIQRPDIGNFEKAIEDALNGFVYVDDSQIIDKDNIRLRWADEDHLPGFEIELEQIVLRKVVE